MSARWQEELELLLTRWPHLEQRDEGGQHWCRLPSYPVPPVLVPATVEIAFRIPGAPGEAPYAFWARPRLEPVGGGALDRYTYPVSTPWGGDWGQFSWGPVSWAPKDDIVAGSNMLNFVLSFGDRFMEGA